MTNKITVDLNLTGEQAMSRGFHNAGDAAEDFGDDLGKAAKDAGFLDKRVGELRGGLRELFTEFSRSGDKDVLKKIRIDQRELNQLQRLQKQMLDLDGDSGIGSKLIKPLVGAGVSAGTKFGEEFTKSLMSLRGPAIGALVGVAAIAAPFVGGVIASAIVGGVGIGGIIGGIALAAQDARVDDAWTALTKRAAPAFAKSADVFIKPIIDSIGVLDSVVDEVAAGMKDAFTAVAPTLVPLTKGLTGLIQEMMPGIVLALNRARPLLLVISEEMPKIGRVIGDFFATVARDPRGAIMAFQDLSRIIQGTIVITGRFLLALSILWGKISPIIRAASGDAAGAAAEVAAMEYAMAEANRVGGELAGGLDGVGDSATEAKNKMMALNEALLKFIGIAQSGEAANIAYERTWDEMIETLSKAKRTLDITTEAGRENREAIEAHARAIVERHRQRMEEGMTLEQSLPLMDAEIQRLRDQVVAMKFNKQEANELINIYATWPTRAVTVIEAQGLEVTIERVQALISLFRTANAMISIGGIAGAKIGGKRAAGGPVLSGQTYLVGEQGPELLTMGAASGQVVNATQTAAMMSGASGGATAYTFNLTAQYTGVPLIDALMTAIAERLRITGGVVGQFKIPRAAA